MPNARRLQSAPRTTAITATKTSQNPSGTVVKERVGRAEQDASAFIIKRAQQRRADRALVSQEVRNTPIAPINSQPLANTPNSNTSTPVASPVIEIKNNQPAQQVGAAAPAAQGQTPQALSQTLETNTPIAIPIRRATVGAAGSKVNQPKERPPIVQTSGQVQEENTTIPTAPARKTEKPIRRGRTAVGATGSKVNQPAEKPEETTKVEPTSKKIAGHVVMYEKPLRRTRVINAVRSEYQLVQKQSKQASSFAEQRAAIKQAFASTIDRIGQLSALNAKWELLLKRCPELAGAHNQTEFEQLSQGKNVDANAWNWRQASFDLQQAEAGKKAMEEQLAEIDKQELEAAKIETPKNLNHAHEIDIPAKTEEEEKKEEKKEELMPTPVERGRTAVGAAGSKVNKPREDAIAAVTAAAGTTGTNADKTSSAVTQKGNTQPSTSIQPKQTPPAYPAPSKVVQAGPATKVITQPVLNNRDVSINNQVYAARKRALANGKTWTLAEALALRQKLLGNFSATPTNLTATTNVKVGTTQSNTGIGHPTSSPQPITRLDNLLQPAKKGPVQILRPQTGGTFTYTKAPSFSRINTNPYTSSYQAAQPRPTTNEPQGSSAETHSANAKPQTKPSPPRQPSQNRANQNPVRQVAKVASLIARFWMAIPFLVVLIIILLFTVIIVIIVGSKNANNALAGPATTPTTTASGPAPVPQLTKYEIVGGKEVTLGTDHKVNDVIQYSIHLAYAGTASDIVVHDPFPDGTSYVAGSADPTTGMTATSTEVAWDLGAVTSPITDQVFHLSLKATKDQTFINNQATVDITNGQTVGGGGAAGATLTIHKTATPNSITSGGTITYTITVSYTGEANDITVSDSVPADTSLQPGGTSPVTVKAISLTWSLKALQKLTTSPSSFANQTITYTVKVNPGINNTEIVSLPATATVDGAVDSSGGGGTGGTTQGPCPNTGAKIVLPPNDQPFPSDSNLAQNFQENDYQQFANLFTGQLHCTNVLGDENSFVTKVLASGVLPGNDSSFADKVHQIYQTATTHNINPALIVATWGVESTFGTAAGENFNCAGLFDFTLGLNCEVTKFNEWDGEYQSSQANGTAEIGVVLDSGSTVPLNGANGNQIQCVYADAYLYGIEKYTPTCHYFEVAPDPSTGIAQGVVEEHHLYKNYINFYSKITGL